MIFDDTFTHEAWNRSDEKRLVLNIDIKRPEIEDSVEEVCRAQFFKFVRFMDEHGRIGFHVDQNGRYSAVLPKTILGFDDVKPIPIHNALPGISDDIARKVIQSFYPNYK